MTAPFIDVADLRKTLGGVTVLDDVTMTIERGETTLLMGPNGSGKTILLCCLASGLTPDDGRIRINGSSPRECRSRFSLMLQDGMSSDRLTGRENLDFYTDLHPRDDGRGVSFATRLGIDDALDSPVGDYSGGMTRKLELAAALAPDVPLYLLDEPTAELDPTTVDRVHGLIETAAESSTVVLSSHLPRDVALADRIVFFADGQVITAGPPTDLLDEVPKVVQIPVPHQERVAEHVLQGRLFESQAGARGFLQNGSRAAIDAIDAASMHEPNTTDLYNYHVFLAPETSDKSPKRNYPTQ